MNLSYADNDPILLSEFQFNLGSPEEKCETTKFQIGRISTRKGHVNTAKSADSFLIVSKIICKILANYSLTLYLGKAEILILSYPAGECSLLSTKRPLLYGDQR